MAWFEDLQPCTAFPGEWKNLLAVGWLAKGHDYSRGPLDPELLRQLNRTTWQPPNLPGGAHRCDLCVEGEHARSESGVLFFPGDGVLYAAPRLIRHYMLKHGYSPPPEFLRAVRQGPAPYSQEYQDAVSRHFRSEYEQRVPPIAVPEGIEPVRIRPGMYFGSTDAGGLGRLVFEVFGNSLDEYLSGAATRISVDADDHGWIAIQDDGRGLPVGTSERDSQFEVLFTTLHAGATLDGHHPHVHVRSDHHGAGLGAVNAVCARLEVETRRDGVAYRAAFECGQVVEKLRSLGPTQERGTLIRFLPDDEVFDVGARLGLEAVEAPLESIAWLCPKLDLRLQGRSLQRAEGLPGWVRHLAPDIVKETVLSAIGTVNDVDVEVALGWRPRGTEPLIQAYANYALTNDPGSHHKGLLSAVEKVIGQKRASRKKKVLSGLVAVVHVGMLHPKFGGPTRARLEVDAARVAVHEVVTRAINEAPWWWDRLHEAIG